MKFNLILNRNLFFTIALFFTFLFSSTAQPIELYQQFYGKYDYVAIGNTLNTVENNGVSTPCVILSSSSAALNLNPDQPIIAAFLYWAGSGSGDYQVKLNGEDINAERTFFINVNAGSGGVFPMSGAFTDVTQQVLATGNGTYTLSDLDLSNDIVPHC